MPIKRGFKPHFPQPKLRNPSPEKLDALLHEDLMRSAQNAPLSDGAIEARRRIAAAQLKYQQQQNPEKAMPDIKTAIHTALSAQRKASIMEVVDAWSDDDKTPQTTKENAVQPYHFKATNNVTRETFNYVRDNPGKTAKQIMDSMGARGYKTSSVRSLLGQMVLGSMLAVDAPTGTYHAIKKEYSPMKASVLKAGREQTKKSLSKTIKQLALKHIPITRDYPARQAPTVNIDVQAIKNRNTPEGIATLNAAHAQATLAPSIAAPTPKLLTAAQVLETLSIKEAHILYRELQSMFGN